MTNQQNTIRIQAEDYQSSYDLTKGNSQKAYRNDDVDICQNGKNGSGNGFHICSIRPGEWLNYDLDIPASGTYQIVARVKTHKTRDKKISLSLDGKRFDVLSFNKNTSNKLWQDVASDGIKLSKGSHKLRLDMYAGNFAFDYLELIPIDVKQENTNSKPIATSKETPSASEPVVEAPSISEPVTETPANSQPVVETPSVSEPVTETPANSQPLVTSSNPTSNINSVKSVKIGGGGFVTGITIHPKDANVMYARTDVGGLYRWNPAKQDWVQLISKDSVGKKVSPAIESMAIDPNNVNTIYAASGAYTHKNGKENNGHLLKSTNGGKSWSVLNLSVPMGGNEDWRWTGERIAVDPHNSNNVYFGSRLDGLWRSTNGGKSWSQINTSNVPIGSINVGSKGAPGVTFIEFDEYKKGVAYVGVAGKGVYQTTNGGNSWKSLSGLPGSIIPQQGEINGDGELVITFFDGQKNGKNGGVWRYNGSGWKNITPQGGKNYAGLTVAESDPNTLYTVGYPMRNDVYRSTDGGDSWTPLKNELTNLGWYPDWSFYTLSGDLAVDPNNSNNVWLSNGLSIWHTDDGGSSKSTWSPQIKGIEETVPFDAVSTPGGASLITVLADFDGFRHENIESIPQRSHSGEFNTTTSIDYSKNNPNFLARVGGNHHNPSKIQAGFSTDNGRTWQNFDSIKNGNHPKELTFGNVAVSATNTNNIVWQGSNDSAPYYTKDRGKTWNKINFFHQQFGIGSHTHLWNRQQTLAADSVDGSTFYMYHYKKGSLAKTTNGGANWSIANKSDPLPNSWDGAKVKTLPGVKGEVWVGIDEKGLYRSSDGGTNFTKISGVEDVDAFDFGKSASNSSNPTLFISGEIEGKMGVFGSTNLGKSWSQVDDLPDEFLGEVRTVTGDMNTFGRVYVGAGSNGFVYGDL